MPPKLNSSFRIPARFAPLFFFLGCLVLLFAIYLFVRSASSRLTLQNLQNQHHLLVDQKRILEGQVAQLQAEHRQKEAFVRMAEKELSLGEQQELASHLETAQNQEKQAQQKALAAGLELNLRRSASAKEVELLFAGRDLIIRFYESTLFNPGEISVTPAGKKLLATVAQSLNHDFSGCSIRVEGHSDNTAVSGGLKARFPSNWELSAFRAAAVARSLEEGSQIDPFRLTPVGKAGTFPIDQTDTREGRLKNRRIDLVISPPASTGSGTPADSPIP